MIICKRPANPDDHLQKAGHPDDRGYRGTGQEGEKKEEKKGGGGEEEG